MDQVKRGDVLATPGVSPHRPAGCLVPPAAGCHRSVKHDSEVKLFVLASEVVARLRLLGTEELLPGEIGWLQLELREPVIAVRGDRYILRRPSPGETLGGGIDRRPSPGRPPQAL